MADFDFLKEEYLTLRKEVELAMAELNVLETYCVYGTAAAFVWLSSNPLDGALLFAWFIPLLLVAFGAARSWAIAKHLG